MKTYLSEAGLYRLFSALVLRLRKGGLLASLVLMSKMTVPRALWYSWRLRCCGGMPGGRRHKGSSAPLVGTVPGVVGGPPPLT